MKLPSYVRTEPGGIERIGNRLVVSDDPTGVLGDVLHVAVASPDRDLDTLLTDLTPDGDEYTSGAGHMIILLEDPEDVPGEFSPPLSEAQLSEHELWMVVLDTWGRGSEHVILTGTALRASVRRAADALAS